MCLFLYHFVFLSDYVCCFFFLSQSRFQIVSSFSSSTSFDWMISFISHFNWRQFKLISWLSFVSWKHLFRKLFLWTWMVIVALMVGFLTGVFFFYSLFIKAGWLPFFLRDISYFSVFCKHLTFDFKDLWKAKTKDHNRIWKSRKVQWKESNPPKNTRTTKPVSNFYSPNYFDFLRTFANWI